MCDSKSTDCTVALDVDDLHTMELAKNVQLEQLTAVNIKQEAIQPDVELEFDKKCDKHDAEDWVTSVDVRLCNLYTFFIFCIAATN